jgi:pimeloyl-ACP methyl ester carboxylesterase/uncharacterized membrane protein HdeD (DUF308 family)
MRRETVTFTAATALALVHALDDAFVHRGEGLGMSQHALAGLIAVAAAVAGIVAFPRLRPGLRAALAFAFGVLALVNGVLHVIHAEQHGAAGGDITGFLAAAAGVALVELAIEILVRHRGTWRSRAVGYPASLLVTLFVLGPIALGIVATHKWREPVGEPPSAAYRDVAFQATDGLDLRGWYRPSRNGTAVLVVHGGSSDRKGSVAHAEMLADHGYGVLLYDARGRGESDGSENNYGWDWAKDIEGALAFLHAQDGVDRIAALGLSTGADVLLEVAAERDDLAAVVADGAAAGSFQDWQNLRGTEIGTPPGFVMFATIRVLSGDAPGTPLMDAVRRIDEPTLLISAGETDERNANVRYEAAATGPVEHWNLSGAEHTHAIRTDREAYEQRVVGFIGAALK